MPFDLGSTRMVVAGTGYGEARSGGYAGMADVGCVLQTRVGHWQDSLLQVCLQHSARGTYQFSCWSPADPNRAAILRAPEVDPQNWAIALRMADDLLAGRLVDRTGGADSYYAASMSHPPYWARPPSRHTVTLLGHCFWICRDHASGLPIWHPPISIHAPVLAEHPTADDLMAAEQTRLAAGGAA